MDTKKKTDNQKEKKQTKRKETDKKIRTLERDPFI